MVCFNLSQTKISKLIETNLLEIGSLKSFSAIFSHSVLFWHMEFNQPHTGKTGTRNWTQYAKFWAYSARFSENWAHLAPIYQL